MWTLIISVYGRLVTEQNQWEALMILVTGTSGVLGGLVLERLRADSGSEDEKAKAGVVAGTRTPGDDDRHIDFDNPDTLADGFAGVDVLVFVSAGSAEDDVVLARHGAVVAAASEARVRHVIYTSPDLSRLGQVRSRAGLPLC
ncbi:hypothetical protein Franean1_2870 [Parafrankia sp. EAN1pec]|uniref:hypothetical protein n=1 Tax=Parafrankia sp. (strain EAN1pec) TaxID=298653 RepID=UPI00015D9D45|nr:hypothetical protein Franean1_2870 [Frankia sp. EAN1pec]